MTRIEGWEDRLLEVIAKHQARPYEAGVSDCFMMAMDAIEALTGERPYADARYTTDLGAARVLKRKGFADLGEAMRAVLPETSRSFARRGDLALIPVEQGFGVALGVVVGGGVIAWRSDVVKILPLAEASGFLAVG